MESQQQIAHLKLKYNFNTNYTIYSNYVPQPWVLISSFAFSFKIVHILLFLFFFSFWIFFSLYWQEKRYHNDDNIVDHIWTANSVTLGTVFFFFLLLLFALLSSFSLLFFFSSFVCGVWTIHMHELTYTNAIAMAKSSKHKLRQVFINTRKASISC